MKITGIKIKNIKGIDEKCIDCVIYENKPTFFIAKNGTGKSSLARAFDSVNKNKLVLDENDYYMKDKSNIPEIAITCETDKYIIDENKNEFSSICNTFVIGTNIKAEGKSRNNGVFTTTQSKIAIKSIVLYEKIPPKINIEYSFSNMKKNMGKSAGKIVINLKNSINNTKETGVLLEINSNIKSLSDKFVDNLILNIAELNSLDMKADDLKKYNFKESKIPNSKYFDNICSILREFIPDITLNEILVNTIQINDIFKDKDTKAIAKYLNFKIKELEINDLIKLFNSSWMEISTKKIKNKLIINFPNATDISNGERDLIYFISKLFEFNVKVKYTNNLLIIDELFDYLDDSNIIAAQYFLNKSIEYMKSNKKKVYIILLTHLDPHYFNCYSFNTKNCVYLNSTHNLDKNYKYKIDRLILDRKKLKEKDESLYNFISANFLHFSVRNVDCKEYFNSLNLNEELFNSITFRNVMKKEIEKYINDKTYDAILVCTGLRLCVEENVYSMLSDSVSDLYFEINTTKDRLLYGLENELNISESYFLLSYIYNDALHLDANNNKIKSISMKLNNKVICQMIKEIYIYNKTLENVDESTST